MHRHPHFSHSNPSAPHRFAMRGGGRHRGAFDGDWGMGDARGGGRGRRRMFDGGELKLVLLKLIEAAPRHGYDLIREIEELTGGAYAPSPGVVYPTITLLSEMELIDEQAAEGAKKVYAITPAGSAHLAERAAEVEALFARLAALASDRERTDGAPIRRAMTNLKIALKQRLSGADDVETMHRAAAILDEAAQKIERL